MHLIFDLMKVVSPRRAQLVLSEFGHRYNSNSILQSELRILKTLNYKVMLTTPFVYVETILEILGGLQLASLMDEPCAFYPKTCWDEYVFIRC